MNMNTLRPSILVVDDDPDLLRLMQIRLSAAGYSVMTAESAERALAQLAVNGRLPKQFAVIGFARTEMNDDSFREFVREAIAASGMEMAKADRRPRC